MFSGIGARFRSLWGAIRRRDQFEAEMTEEFQHHMDLRAADLVRSGLVPADAARRARHEFGLTELYAQKARASRGLREVDRIRFSWLDVKLGFRMLRRYPGLTLVGGFAIAFAIWVGVSAFDFVRQIVDPTLPLRDGDRIVALRLWNTETSRAEHRAAFDFATWQRQLRTITDLGAHRVVRRNLAAGDGPGEPVDISEITASAFRFAPHAPILGRALVDEDQRPDAPAVVLLGFDLWRSRFASDANVVGRTVRIGGSPTTVVGIMPRDFGFPVSNQLWVPLRIDGTTMQPVTGPGIRVFGRLAPGVTMAEAQAELTALGARLTIAHPLTHERLRPQVMPYAKSVIDLSGVEAASFRSVNVFLAMLLALVCGNVALLIFARAAAREAEIVVRSALGAGRGRIIGQFLAEALVLSGLASMIGLVAAGSGLRWFIGVIQGVTGPVPFWFTGRLSPGTIAYALGLTFLSTAIIGALPALKVTRRLADRLRASSAGGGGPSVGGVWTLVIVAQIAMTIAFPVMTFAIQRDSSRIESMNVGFPDHEYLSARLVMDAFDRDPSASDNETERARYAAAVEKLETLLADEPLVSGVTFGDLLPRMYHPARFVELDEGGAAPLHPDWPAHRVSAASVDRDFFDVLGAPILHGRGFNTSDLSPDRHVAIVNESFVRVVLGGRNPIGRHVRSMSTRPGEAIKPEEERGPWYEVVGVVKDLGMAPYDPNNPAYAGFYLPTDAGRGYPVRLAIHVKGDPSAFAARLRVLVERVDPRLGVDEVMPLHQVRDGELRFLDFWLQVTSVVCAMALLLSLAGIYAVMSYTVSRRTREIGIRIALGADRRRLVLSVFRGPLRQVGLGVVAGAVLVALLSYMILRGSLSVTHVGVMLAYAVFMLTVCLMACAIPTRRALSIEPTEALRTE